MRLGIDLDEVLSDTLASFIQFHNLRYGTDYRESDFVSYKFEDIMKLPSEDVVVRILQFYSECNAEISPVAGAKGILEKLARDHELYVITARPDAIKTLTRIWLEDHYPGLFKEVIFAHNIYVGCARRKKLDFCQEHDIKMMIDDTLENIADCQLAGIQGVLYDRPWNRGNSLDSVIRVSGWEHIAQIVEDKNPV